MENTVIFINFLFIIVFFNNRSWEVLLVSSFISNHGTFLRDDLF